MTFKHTILFISAGLAIISCKQKVKPAEQGHSMIDRANMDTTIRPGDDFYGYANGKWLKKNPIPKSESEWGSFNEVQENTYKTLHALLDSAAAIGNAPMGSNVQKVGDLYRSGMDSTTINKLGLTPLNELMIRINNISDASSLLEEITFEHAQGLGQLFNFGVGPDDKNVTHEICQFSQGGLGLPGKEYYFDNDERTVKIRNAYKQYIPNMLILLGEDKVTADKDAVDIYNLERSLAEASLNQKEMRDPYRLYNKYTIDEVDKLTPGIEWKSLLSAMGVNGQETIIVAEPRFFAAAARYVKSVPADVWKKYLKFHLVNNMAPYLSHEFDSTQFDFYSRTIYGLQDQNPRWKRILQVVDEYEGELLGQLYIERKFRADAKARMVALVDNLQKAYADRIQKLTWMSDATKQKALTKLTAIVKKIGYPDTWKDYSALIVTNNDYVKNIISASQWNYKYEIGKLGKPVDKKVWTMTPPTINAYYNPAFNEVVFPAGILQFPFFDENADDAVNYGGIGAVIGHEMTHGFDDQGRLYNAEGNLANWWVPIDATNFNNRAKVVGEQFRKIMVIDGIHANDSLTEGENLADLGGLSIAYDAFKKTKQGQGAVKIDGFTPDQRFFLSWAQVWRTNQRPEALAAQVKSDPHSPAFLRVNVPLSNFDAWYAAFNVKPGDKLYRSESERAKVW